MRRLSPLIIGAISLSLGCGAGSSPSPSGASKAPEDHGIVAGQSGDIVLYFKSGLPSKNPDICPTEVYAVNETGTDIHAGIFKFAWNTLDGSELEITQFQVSQVNYGYFVEEFKAGAVKQMHKTQFMSPCDNLELVGEVYACRDDRTLYYPCPGPVTVKAEGIKVLSDNLEEGRP